MDILSLSLSPLSVSVSLFFEVIVTGFLTLANLLYQKRMLTQFGLAEEVVG